jgi:lipase maturation factor 1
MFGWMRKIFGMPFQTASEYELTAWLFLKGLALVYLAAFLSLAVQIDGLAGSGGILPFRELLDEQFTHYGYAALLLLPNLFWINCSDMALQGAAYAGAVLAVLLFFGWCRQRVILVLLFLLYLSLYHAGQTFTNFQWDYLLLESGFLAIFLVNVPTRLLIFLYHWLLFRLRFLSGFSKLASGDPSWSGFSALKYYFETQPLPHVGAWYVHQLPDWMLGIGVALTFFAELVVPFFIFLPRRFRLIAAAVTIAMQLLIIATSNHNFFNLLTILLCLFLLDDKLVTRWIPKAFRPRQRDLFQPPVSGAAGKAAIGAGAVMILALSGTMMVEMLTQEPLSEEAYWFASLGPRYGIGNVYHVFPTMQTERQELQIAGSDDGIRWKHYVFRYKPGKPGQIPGFIVPHQPRLDWMMWFVPPQGDDMHTWFPRLLDALAKNNPAVTRLLAVNPFEGKAPPLFLRVEAYRYRFTTPEERARSGDWWKIDYLGEFPNVPPRIP